MTSSASRNGRPRSALRRFIKGLLYRGYALLVIFIIVGLTWMAFDYLVGAMIRPAETPEVILDLPRRLDPQTFKRGRTQWPALQEVLHPRSPLSHYHRLESWIQDDLGNDCTTSGCHSPMPHARSKEVRAFLNMHGTTLHCGVCHMASADDESLRLTWYDPATGLGADEPAVLKVLKLVNTLEANPGRAQQVRIAEFLQQAVEQSDEHPELVSLWRHFRAARPDGKEWPELIAMARSALPRHFRGEYGRKIALASPRNQPILGHPDTEAAKEQFLRLGDGAGRAALLDEIHPLQKPDPRRCSACHASQETLFDYEELGYSDSRMDTLKGQIVSQMIENIAEGNKFYLPNILEGGNDR